MRSALNKYLICVAGLLVMMVSISGCSNEKRLAKGKPLKNRSSGAILSRYYRTEFQYEWLGMKIAADVENAEDKQGFKANIRMRKDSIIWISITPLMGVEMVRAVITPDSIKYISKVPNQKHYFMGELDQLTDITKTEVSFGMLQNILIGNAVDINEQDDKFISRIDDQEYVLISKYNRKLKKVVGMDEKQIDPDDSLEIELNDKKYRKILKRSEEEDLLMKRYWFDGYDYRLLHTVFDDLYYQRSLEVHHEEFKEVNGQYYPKKTSMVLGTIEGNTVFSFEINRIRLGKQYDFPFEIPDDFERKYAP